MIVNHLCDVANHMLDDCSLSCMKALGGSLIMQRQHDMRNKAGAIVSIEPEHCFVVH
jgi:hypothetical protein